MTATSASPSPLASQSSSYRTLSRSDFALARTCDAKLYFRENGYPDNRQLDRYLQLLAEGGYMVEALALAKRPEGISLEHGHDPAGDFERTLAHLQRERVTLFHATLMWGRRLTRADILEKNGSVVRLVEVRAKSFDGAAHLASIANGGAGVFRGVKKPYGILAEWRARMEDVTYQTLILEHVLPGVTVQPRLVLVDRSKRSALDHVPTLFRLERRESADGTGRVHTAQFIGDGAQLAALDLLTEVDVSVEVTMLRAEVEEAAARYEALLDAPFDLSLAARGAKCKECEFVPDDPAEKSGFAHCWGALAHVRPHVLDLHSIGTVKAADGTPIVESLLRDGKACLLDVPEDRLVKKDGTVGPQAERQLRQIRCYRSGETWIGPGLRRRIESLAYPIHFIDFEVSRLALPYHAGMRTYGQVAFQWSCHTVESPGAPPTHREWLNTADSWPNKSFALALREAVGDGRAGAGAGAVLTWSSFEASRLAEIVRELPAFEANDPELVAWITNLCARRIVDLQAWARDDFLHPAMRGRTSIKAVLDALWKSDAVMRDQLAAWTGLPATESADPYDALPPLEINGVRQDVREGTGAIRAYEAMMYGCERDDEATKQAWRALLLQYCKLDTLSMVLIFEHWRRATGVADVPSPA
ncbi:MAG: DUF2779 domain-containing protein [Gemmatimonadaceae bacterium]